MSKDSESISTSPRFEEISDDDDPADLELKSTSYYTTAPSVDTSAYLPWSPHNPCTFPEEPPKTPELYTTRPLLRDDYVTHTLREQENTASVVLPLLSAKKFPLPELKRDMHIEFLESGVDGEALPPSMTALDASRGWMVYWCLNGLSLLGVDVSEYRESVISTFTPLQNSTGGFGGGFGQYSHLAPTYATILSLAIVGDDALAIVDRRAILRWLHTLKNPNGSFAVCVGGETDVRGVYCALTIMSLLRLPVTASLLENTSNYLTSCQTYEGGFGANSTANEAHGGYTFCALAALCILHPPTKLVELLDMDALVRWLSARQYAPEGGLSGRTNKLVDGCYCTWIGGCWAFVEAAVGAEGPLWDREGMVRYILAATQGQRGGLRDKPGKSPDFYHSNYILLGLSSVEYQHSYDSGETEAAAVEAEEGLPLLAPFRWKSSTEVKGVDELVKGFEGWPDKRWYEKEAKVELDGLKGDRVAVAHPVFNIRAEFVERVEEWAEGLVGF